MTTTGGRISYLNNGRTLGTTKDLNVLERCPSTPAGHTQTLEHGFLGAPPASEAGLRRRCLAAVFDFGVGEVALDEVLVGDVDARNMLGINTNASVGVLVVVHRQLLNNLPRVLKGWISLAEGLRGVSVGAFLLVRGDTSSRIEED